MSIENQYVSLSEWIKHTYAAYAYVVEAVHVPQKIDETQKQETQQNYHQHGFQPGFNDQKLESTENPKGFSGCS